MSLTRDLFKLYQSGSVEDYYSKISRIVALLINLLNLGEENAAVKNAKSNLYQQMGLKVFLSGLRDPLGPIIRAQSPNTLKDALRLCLEENNYNLCKSTKQTISPQPQSFQQIQPQRFQQIQPQRFQEIQPQRFQQGQQPRMVNPVPQQRNNQPISQPGSSWRVFSNTPGRNNQQIPLAEQQRPTLPPRNFAPPRFNPNSARLEPMEVDSVRSNQINYMNRSLQARSLSGPHYQIEVDQYPNYEYDQSYPVEQEKSSQPTFNVEPEQVQVQESYDGSQTVEATVDDLNFCMAIDNNLKR